MHWNHDQSPISASNEVLIDPQKLVGSIQTELNENALMVLSDGEIIGRVNFDFQLRR